MPKELLFRLEDNGNFTVTHPTSLMESLGLCEMAKDAIRMRFAQEQAKKVQPPNPADVLAFGRKS